MRLNNILITFLLLSSLSLKAQRFKGGILVGMNASQVDGDEYGGFYKGGLLAGAFVQTDLRDKFGAQLEIKYSAKGAGAHKDKINPITSQLNYIDVPIIVQYEAIENLKIETGVSFNYLFKAEQSFNGTFYKWPEGEGPDSFETAMLLGVNYTFFTRFDLNIRWNYSLFPIHSTNNGAEIWYNNVLNFGLYFHLGQQN